MDTLKAKVCVRRDTTANWEYYGSTVPLRGEVIVYTDYKTVEVDGVQKLVPGVKIGDGETTVAELPFTDAAINIDGKADKADTVLDTTLSRGRKDYTAIGTGSVAFGNIATASGNYSQAFGGNTEASGNYATAKGYSTKAYGSSASAEGSLSQATGNASHAEGGSTQATNSNAHAEGSHATASGAISHAEGSYTTASGTASHAEGNETTASGNYSHAEGRFTTASGTGAHVEGYYTTAAGDYSHVSGKFNVTGQTGYAEVIGGGTSTSSRKNLRTLDWNGNEFLKGNLLVQCGNDSSGGNVVATERYVTNQKGAANGIATLNANGKVPESQLPAYVDDVLEFDAKDFSEWPEWVSGTNYVVGNKVKQTLTDGNQTTVNGYICTVPNVSASILPEEWDTATKFPETGESGKIYIALDTNISYRWGGTVYVAIASDLALGETEYTAYRGDRGKAAYDAAVANVDTTPTTGSTHLITSGGVKTELDGKADKNNPTFTGSMSLGGTAEATGENSVALGDNVYASGDYSFALGYAVQAEDFASHAEGAGTDARGAMSHAEGVNTIAEGRASHADGEGTWATHRAQHTFGMYNKTDDSPAEPYERGTYIEIVGNGTSNSGIDHRSNARALDWDGNERIAGDLYVGCNADSSGGTKVATVAELATKAAAIVDEDTGYRHENVDSFVMNGNAYAFGNARYADKKNIIVATDKSFTLNSVNIDIHGGIAVLNGTNSGSGNDGTFAEHAVDMPIGNYIFKVEPYAGQTVLSDTKNVHLDIWYDGNETSTKSKRVTLAINATAQSSTFSIDTHAYKIKVWIGVRGSSTYDDYRLFYSLFPSNVTITDTGETISSTGTLTVTPASEMSVVDTMMHSSTVETIIDTKTYVDNHTQEIDFVYFRPEDYGAKGDGSTDDSIALQACINAAQAYDTEKGKAIRGLGTYKIATGLVFNCRELDVYIHKIIYTGSDAAVQISGSFSRFAFQSIRAYSGGNSAVCIRCYQSANSGYTTTFHSNVVTCSYMRSSGNCVEFAEANGVTIHTIMYNDFYCQYQKSDNANIFAILVKLANEINCYGKYVNAQSGYFVYFNTNIRAEGIIRMFYYCLETDLKNGTNGMARFYYCRFAEMTNLQTIADRTSGRIYAWDNMYPQGEIVSPTGGVDLTSIDVSNADSWADCLAKVKADFESDSTQNTASVYERYIPTGRRPYAIIDSVRRTANANLTTNNSMVTIPFGSAYVYYKNIAFKPNEDIYAFVDADMTIELTAENNWAYITPTTFDIDAASVTITLDSSYCCIAINEFDVIQHTGKEAIVVDKLGNTIFDGTGLGAGVYHFKCNFVPYQEHEVYVTLENGTVKYLPTSLLPIVYSGNNESWTVINQGSKPTFTQVSGNIYQMNL